MSDTQRTAQELADSIEWLREYCRVSSRDDELMQHLRVALASQAEPEVFGWAVVDKDGYPVYHLFREFNHRGTRCKAPPLKQGTCDYHDEEYPGGAPHRLVTLYTTTPAPAQAGQSEDGRDAARWRFVVNKLCLTGNGDGTCSMHAINLPNRIPGWPAPDEVTAFCAAAIDAAIAAKEQS